MNEQLKIAIVAEVNKFKQDINNAKKSISDFKEQVKKASEDVDKNFQAMGEGIKNGLANAAKAGTAAVASIGAALVGTSALTADYRKEQAKLVTAFETAGSSAETAKQTYNDLYRVLGEDDTAVEAANHLAKLTKDQKSLSEWTNICQGVYATFGASLPIEGLTEAANETAKVGQLTGGLADALNWAGISEDAFNEKLATMNTEAEREAYIRTTLNGLYSEAAANYETTAAQTLAQNEANAQLQATLATLGEAMAPIVTIFTNFANDALAKVTPYITELAEKYGPSLQTVLEETGRIVSEVFTVISENWEIFAGIAAVIGGIATAIGIYNTVAAIKAAMAAAEVTTVWALASAYAAQAAAMIVAIAPYVLAVAAIAAVIAIIVLCIKHWDDIKEAVAKAWEWIKDKTKAAVDAVVGFFTKLGESISEKLNAIKEFFANIFEAIKQSVSEKLEAAKEIVMTIFGAIADNIKEKIEFAKNIISNVVAIIKGIFTGDFGAARDAVLNIFDSIRNGIKDKINKAKDFVGGAIEKIKGFFNFKWELPKIKLPHFSITGKFSLDPPSIPKFSVKWYKLGGVFDTPTFFGYGNGQIGGMAEDGAEAIVPLEKNTQWLDKIADRLASRQSAPTILQVDGKVFAETAVRTINDLTRQTGKLDLAIV